MADDDEKLGAYIDTVSAMIGLTIDARYRAGVIENLRRAKQIADAGQSAPLPDDLEAAPVFRP
jgi:hypothetical protein